MLPRLREELELYAGPPSAQGAPTWALQDPVRNLFYRLDWLTFEILSRWHLNDPAAITGAIDRETAIESEVEDVAEVILFLANNELIQRHQANDTQWYERQAFNRRVAPLQWLLHHYLFFRLPLWSPDEWLQRWLPWVNRLFSKTFAVVTFVALVLGVLEVSRQWDTFTASLIDTFTLAGMASFAVTMVWVKFMHELGHAFTARRFGCRVPTMGVAFLVLFPMAYTDVNETWKLPKKNQRLAVGAAGIVTELVIAAWATLAWALLPDGLLRDAAFLLAAVTWISTVFINISPFLRFDGYFLCMDWLEMPNLHQRSFALAKWRIREWIFGLSAQPPEYLSITKCRTVIGFALFTWIYRLIVFSGIAVLVYTMLPKPLGPLLALVELMVFIVIPIWRELGVWFSYFPQAFKSFRLWFNIILFVVFFAVFALPWDQRIHSQGLLTPVQHYQVITANAAILNRMPAKDGQKIAKGETLIDLYEPDIAYQQQGKISQQALLDWQINAAGVDDQRLDYQRIYTAERDRITAEIQSINDRADRNQLTAPFSGNFYFESPDLNAGEWLKKNQRVGVLVDVSAWRVETYLSGAELKRIRLGDVGYFYSETPDLFKLKLRVEHINHDVTRRMNSGFLASTRGGQIPVREVNDQFIPERAIYKVSLLVDSDVPVSRPRILRGSIIINGQAKSYFDDFITSAGALVVREAGF